MVRLDNEYLATTRLKIAVGIGMASFLIGVLLRTYARQLSGGWQIPNAITDPELFQNKLIDLRLYALSVEAGWWTMGFGAFVLASSLCIWVIQGSSRTESHE